MRRYSERFQQLTHRVPAIELRDSPALADPALFARLEQSAQQLLRIVESLPPDSFPPRGTRDIPSWFHLEPGRFGPRDDLRDLADASSIWREFVTNPQAKQRASGTRTPPRLQSET